jgi:hypothetical protein
MLLTSFIAIAGVTIFFGVVVWLARCGADKTAHIEHELLEQSVPDMEAETQAECILAESGINEVIRTHRVERRLRRYDGATLWDDDVTQRYLNSRDAREMDES